MAAHPAALADWVIVLPVVLGLLGGAVLLMLRRFTTLQPWLCLAILLLILLCDGVLVQRVLSGGPLSMTMGNWLPPFGISFTADAMGAGFATVATFVAFAVVLSLIGVAPENAVRDGVYPLVLLLVAGVSGAFLTGDLFNLYVWFEVMLIASFGLLVLAGNPLQLDGAVKYGVVNFLATTLFLASLGLLYGLVGTLNMADLVGAAQNADLAPLTAIAALFALAFGMKAAAFPINAWLPASYHTPPSAISALIGGLLTKVGLYALLRTLLMLLPEVHAGLAPVLAAVAIATMLLGPLSAIAETNLRRAIGFLLIGGVGVALIGVADPQQAAAAGAVAYVAHAILTIAALYLVAGLIEAATGAFDTRQMGGLYATNSAVSILFFLLVLAIAGIPPFLGFWPKLLLLRGLVADGNWLLVFSLLLSSLLTLIAGARLWSHIFWRPRAEPAQRPQGLAPAVLLAGTIVLLGFWPNLLLNIADAAASGLLDPARYIAAVGLAP